MTEAFAYLDEDSKRTVRRTILKALAIPGYQVPFSAPEMPIAYGWGVGGMVVTASLIGRNDCLKITDHGSDETVNAVNLRAFFLRTTSVRTTTFTREATLIQVRQRAPEAALSEGQVVIYQVPRPDPLRAIVNSAAETNRMHAHADYGRVYTRLFEEQAGSSSVVLPGYDYPVMAEGRYLMSPSPLPKRDNLRLNGSPAIQIFGAARERRLYALPPYTRVESVAFDDVPFDPGYPTDGRRCVICGSMSSHLDHLLLKDDGTSEWVCSDTECCAARTGESSHV
ncbi:alpha-D-ribose 1-methylphosphonate 5-phosphate C-P-lyase PhnJ [Brucella sp. C7-11G]